MNSLIVYLLQQIFGRPEERMLLLDLESIVHNSLTLSPHQGDRSDALRGDLRRVQLSRVEIEDVVQKLFEYIALYPRIGQVDLAASVIGTTYCYTTKHLDRLIHLMKRDEGIEGKIKAVAIAFLEYLDQSYINKHIDYVRDLKAKYPDDQNLQDVIEGVMHKYEKGEYLA